MYPFLDVPSSQSTNGLEAIGSVELTPLQFVIDIVGDLVYKTEEDRYFKTMEIYSLIGQ